mmetsp:Transcript_10511/g.20984  ORF Transcript_10511/g.20984 Transcript_10511/m.20984 type:complete len:299 (-) Transcript_10511:304-1200(-)
MLPMELSRDTEAVADSLAAMIMREHTNASCSYYEGYLNSSDPNLITADDRTALVDWCYSVVDHCQFSRETVASAMEMVDRFLSMPSSSADDAVRVAYEALRDQSKFQLLTIAALYISIKINEQMVISSDLFSEICSRAYTVEEIEDMERTLLRGLSWRCHVPTAHQVGLSILSLIIPSVDEIPEATWGIKMDEMKYLTELAVRDYYLSTQRTSTVALAALFKASSVLDFRDRKVFMKALSSILVDFDLEDIDEYFTVIKSKVASLIIENISETDDFEHEREDGEDIDRVSVLTWTFLR